MWPFTPSPSPQTSSDPPRGLFTGFVAWFSPLIAPAARAEWCHHGGTIASVARQMSLGEQATHFFGSWHRLNQDSLTQRLLAIDIDPLDLSWMTASIATNEVLDEAAYKFTTLARAYNLILSQAAIENTFAEGEQLEESLVRDEVEREAGHERPEVELPPAKRVAREDEQRAVDDFNSAKTDAPVTDVTSQESLEEEKGRSEIGVIEADETTVGAEEPQAEPIAEVEPRPVPGELQALLTADESSVDQNISLDDLAQVGVVGELGCLEEEESMPIEQHHSLAADASELRNIREPTPSPSLPPAQTEDHSALSMLATIAPLQQPTPLSSGPAHSAPNTSPPHSGGANDEGWAKRSSSCPPTTPLPRRTKVDRISLQQELNLISAKVEDEIGREASPTTEAVVKSERHTPEPPTFPTSATETSPWYNFVALPTPNTSPLAAQPSDAKQTVRIDVNAFFSKLGLVLPSARLDEGADADDGLSVIDMHAKGFQKVVRKRGMAKVGKGESAAEVKAEGA